MSGHPGSKRRFFRLPVVTDTQGNRRVIWPKRKRQGRDGKPMSARLRESYYRCQNGSLRSPLSPGQRRRLRKKHNQAMSREEA